jgi:hypothetical protein
VAISTLNRSKILLEIALTDTSKDALLDQIRPGVEAAIEGYCKRQFAEAARIEFYTGSGESRLLLNQYPVTAVADVRVDLGGNFGTTAGSFGTGTVLTSGVDYALEIDASGTSRAGALRRLGGVGSSWGAWPGPIMSPAGLGSGGSLTAGRDGPVWLAVAGSIRVMYTAGFDAGAMPEDLMLAVDQTVALVYRTGKWGGALQLSSESLGNYSMTLAAQAIASMPPVGSARQILTRYRAVDLTF